MSNNQEKNESNTSQSDSSQPKPQKMVQLQSDVSSKGRMAEFTPDDMATSQYGEKESNDATFG
jgi:hypothetical protein